MIPKSGMLAGLAFTTLLMSCSSSTIGPIGGVLSVKLNTLQGNEGAIMFTINGGPVESVDAVNGVAHTAQIDPTTLRVIVTGEFTAGTIARIRINDVSQASNYFAVVNQVAVRSTYAVREPGSYSLSVLP
jgi:hypothetical protein